MQIGPNDVMKGLKQLANLGYDTGAAAYNAGAAVVGGVKDAGSAAVNGVVGGVKTVGSAAYGAASTIGSAASAVASNRYAQVGAAVVGVGIAAYAASTMMSSAEAGAPVSAADAQCTMESCAAEVATAPRAAAEKKTVLGSLANFTKAIVLLPFVAVATVFKAVYSVFASLLSAIFGKKATI